MNHFEKLNQQIRNFVLVSILVCIALSGGSYFMIDKFVNLGKPLTLASVALISLGSALLAANRITRHSLEPVRFLWQAILHVSPENSNTPAPNLDKARIGSELIRNLCLQIYQLASSVGPRDQSSSGDATTQLIAHNLPLPLFAMDKDQNILFANEAALKYVQLDVDKVIGKSMYSVLDFSFQNENTFDTWLADSRDNKVTGSANWDRVRLNVPDYSTRLLCDMAAIYNKEHPSGAETVIVMYDHTETYSQDEQAISFIALAVHELRTPLTLLRGYIEVFEDEFQGKLNDELSDFMHKMHASAQSLSSFVNNILNVARVEENQLILKLNQENWEDIIRLSVSDMQLRAQVHNRTIEYEVTPGLPPAAVDRVSIFEVINNLLDNAIKYSGNGSKIIVKSYLNQQGLIETSIQDFGIGIASSAIPNLFQKFYRNHRSRAQIGGSGLGLFLSKAIVTAHDGNIWVSSKEGEGSVFTFTVKPYSMLADELKRGDNDGILREAHGWIKNHSMYRR